MTNGFSLVKYTYMSLFGLSAQRLRTTLGSAILTSLAVGFLCISFIHTVPTAHAGMDMSGTHSAYGTSVSSLSPCCNPEASDHMELWKNTFVGIPQVFGIILALAAIAFVAFSYTDLFKLPQLADVVLALKFRQYAREHPDVRLFNSLTLAFARGILHPKTF